MLVCAKEVNREVEASEKRNRRRSCRAKSEAGTASTKHRSKLMADLTVEQEQLRACRRCLWCKRQGGT